MYSVFCGKGGVHRTAFDWSIAFSVKWFALQITLLRYQPVVVQSSVMPRFTVHVRDEWLTVPCKDATCSIKWLAFEALKRYIKNKPDNGGIQHIKDVHFVVRRCQGLGLLDNDDTIEDVLEDNDFVELGNITNMVYMFSVCREIDQSFSSWLALKRLFFGDCLPQILNLVLQDESITCYFTVIFSYRRGHHVTRFHSKSAWDVTSVSLYWQSSCFNWINYIVKTVNHIHQFLLRKSHS